MISHLLVHFVLCFFSFLVGMVVTAMYLSWRKNRDRRNHIAPRSGWEQ